MVVYSDELCHYGVKGMKWGIRRYQNSDGTLTDAGRKHYMYRNRVVQNLKTTDDANRIVSKLSDRDKKLLGASTDKAWIEKNSILETNSRIAKRFIQRYKDIPVSMLEIYISEDGVGEIAIATDPKYSGKGYATRNIESAKKWLNSYRNKSVNELLWSAHQSNDASQNLAKKSGFLEIPNTYYGDVMNPNYKYYRLSKNK